MGKIDSTQFQGYLIGQIIAAVIGAILLIADDFAGAFYGGSYVRTWIYVCLGCGVLGTIIVLIGIGGLVFAAYSAYLNLQAPDEASSMSFVENARKTMLGAGFTAALAAIGALVFIIGNLDAGDWWFDGGFYGAFFGGIFTVIFAKLMMDKIEI